MNPSAHASALPPDINKNNEGVLVPAAYSLQLSMATIPASCIFSADLSAIYRRDKTSSFGERKRNPVLKRVAVTTEQTSSNSGTAVTSSARSFVQEKAQKSSEGEAETSLRRVNVEGDSEESRNSLKDYFDEAKDMIRSDGGPPRWFSPLECGAHSPDSPLLLYLPGLFLYFCFFIIQLFIYFFKKNLIYSATARLRASKRRFWKVESNYNGLLNFWCFKRRMSIINQLRVRKFSDITFFLYSTNSCPH